jgi:hypothetical protein
LVVPVSAHPEAFARFEAQRSFPKSSNEALFEGVPATPEKLMDEFNKLFGK